MTNTNRGEWEATVKELRHLAALLYNGGTPAPQQSGLDVDAAATLIENQGREIERVRTILALAGASGSDPMGLSSSEVVSALTDLLQSPTQAPLQEGATK